MNVTFFVGNGFDLNLGLKTQYRDVYKKYLFEPSNTDTIKKFKKDLCENYVDWADFEMGMAEYASRELSEEQLIECVRDFRNFLIAYLETEQRQWSNYFNDEKILQMYIDEIHRSYVEFYKGLIPNENMYIKKFLANPKRPITNYNTISLNYTIIFDFLIKEMFKYNDLCEYHPVLHPHGEGADGIALGIDNEFQTTLKLSKKGRRSFVKPYFNQAYDSRRIEKAIETIKNSDIICIYGLSLGESDQMWREELVTWLDDNPDRRIIWYAYEMEKVNPQNKDEILDEEERLKHVFLTKLGLEEYFEDYENQIYIPIEKSIFVFPTIEELLNIRLNQSKELVSM